MKKKLKKQILTLFKIGISIALIVLVFSKLDWIQIQKMVDNANPFYFGLAVLLFLLSQYISLFRFEVFIRHIGIRIPLFTNAKLYLVGMFYNFFLPGGVGGDAYKAVLLSKSHKKKLKKVGKVIFLERLLGLVAIGFSLGVLVLLLKTEIHYGWNVLLFFLSMAGSYLFLKLITQWMHAYKKRIHVGFLFSLGIQLCQILCILFILKSFQVEGHYLVYITLFLISSVLSVISFAGLGIREAVFYYGATFFQFNSDISASVALSFSLITAFVSFLGIIYMIKPIQPKIK